VSEDSKEYDISPLPKRASNKNVQNPFSMPLIIEEPKDTPEMSNFKLNKVIHNQNIEKYFKQNPN